MGVSRGLEEPEANARSPRPNPRELAGVVVAGLVAVVAVELRSSPRPNPRERWCEEKRGWRQRRRFLPRPESSQAGPKREKGLLVGIGVALERSRHPRPALDVLDSGSALSHFPDRICSQEPPPLPMLASYALAFLPSFTTSSSYNRLCLGLARARSTSLSNASRQPTFSHLSLLGFGPGKVGFSRKSAPVRSSTPTRPFVIPATARVPRPLSLTHSFCLGLAWARTGVVTQNPRSPPQSRFDKTYGRLHCW